MSEEPNDQPTNRPKLIKKFGKLMQVVDLTCTSSDLIRLEDCQSATNQRVSNRAVTNLGILYSSRSEGKLAESSHKKSNVEMDGSPS